MIQEKDLIEIGKILKSHGVKGEMTFLFKREEFVDIESNFYFFLLDGLFVPFFVEDFCYLSNNSANVKIEEVNTIEEAITYNNTLIFAPKYLLENIQEKSSPESKWEEFIEYSALDINNRLIGVIKNVDDSTINVLFVVINDEGQEILIPATTDFIFEVNSTEKKLYLSLPDGLLGD